MSVKRKPFSQKPSDEIHQKRPRNGFAVDDNANSLTERTQSHPGTILSMVLRNFMCHSLLEIKFDSNMTFITGRNGSGKSAILTALVVGLGGRASLTNRGNSTKGFVKVGKTSASVEIAICNRGLMAFRPSVYGEAIVIQRSFTASGSSSYKIKSETGEVISKQAKDVRQIVYHLNIQIENPVCVLNQDTSRNFLSSNNPTHKYELFMKATMLDALSQEYAKILANKRTATGMLRDREKLLHEMQTQMEELKEKLEQHRNLTALKDSLTDLQGELLWAQVRDAEEEIEHQRRVVRDLRKQHDEVLENTGKRNEKLEALKEKIASLRHELRDVKEQIAVQWQPREDVQQTLGQLRERYNEKVRQKRVVESTIEKQLKNCENVEREVGNVTENMSRVEKERLERTRRIANFEESLAELDAMLQTSRNDLFQVESDIGTKDRDVTHLRTEIGQVEQNIASARASLETLKKSTNDGLALYGREMPNVVREIGRLRSRFKHLPRGPIGSCIMLKDKKWAVAVEGFLGVGFLKAFVVDNLEDNKLLVDIFRRVWGEGKKPMIITAPFFMQVHNVSRYLVHAVDGCVSIFEAMVVSDPVVTNCIIDQMGVESVLLIPDDATAKRLLSDASRVPRNCKQGVTAKGDRYYPDPSYRTYGSRYKYAQYLQVDVEDRRRHLMNSVDNYTLTKQTLSKQYQTLVAQKNEQETARQTLRRKISKLNDERRKLREQLDELRMTVEPEVHSVQILETELGEIKRSLVERRAELEQLEREIADVKESIAETNRKLEKLRDTTSHLEERIEPLEHQITAQSTKEIQLKATKNTSEQQVSACQAKLEKANVELTSKTDEVNVLARQASTVCERMDELRRVPDIMNNMNEVQRTIRKIESDIERPEEIAAKYEDLFGKFTQSAEIMEHLIRDLEELRKAVLKRNRHYCVTLDYFVTYMKLAFEKVLKFRQFKGSIDIDVTNKKLDLVVIPQQGSQGQTKTSNLSGGERSFSTVAFLYSLWQCTQFPFYFLDEFDVYMDKMNRSKVMEVLLHHANQHRESQFVFLTPQDVSFITDKSVTVFRMDDPERRNGGVQ